MNKTLLKERVENFITENKNEERARYDEGRVNTCYEINGVDVKALESFAKQLAKEGVDPANLPLDCHEEIIIAGLTLGYSSLSPDSKIRRLEKLLPYIDNWASCDMIVVRLVGLENQKKFFVNLLHSNRPFFLRVAIIWLLKNALRGDVRGIVDLLNESIKNTNYYVEMALAWAYSDAFVYDFDYMMEFVQKLERYVIRNKTLQKACESNRISPENKAEIRKLRSKLLGMDL